jgi:ABC-type phosphate/phosphonate transport system permease subunit
VVLCGILLGIDSTCQLVSLIESGIMAIFLAVAALGRGILGKVFLDMAEAIANGKGGGAKVLVVDHAD